MKYELAKRNAFRGGETVAWNIFGSYEWQMGRHRQGGNSMLNSFEVGSSLNFELPRFAFPFVATPSALPRHHEVCPGGQYEEPFRILPYA